MSELLCACAGYCAIDSGGGLLHIGVTCRKRHQDEIDRLRAENAQLRIDKITLGNFGVLPNYRSQEAEIDRLRAEVERLNKIIGAYQVHPKHRKAKEGE